ncbi:TetR/AcrR family transcriptional regulator [Tenuibacillus multivorans]|uniref:DNA-binding transcriptional regulator, AcrR family n=1 Tax=Tenuibacillus multivorans TaxID=237069 RepID=A0A1G9X0D9_9BACI|nr:TetR/AcrR family transcriptional regulator [Tenuibacillus multivorans]GEL77280.1 TetR family transcriptional regulator [Tenuibacillus multivorans]SDM90167.1 DNA-binding transcriptional regulator, AcrR family [Tenuibacillus multivorans]
MVKHIVSSVKDEKLIEQRREELQKGAVSLFKQKGFHRATTREIARAAGFSIGTLYEYIRKKEDVLFLVCDAIYDEVKARMEAVIDTQETSEEALHQAVKSYFQLMDDMQDEVLVLYQELKALPKDAQEYVLDKEKEMVTLLEKVIQNSYPALSEQELSIITNNIFIQGQMWGFRRWILQKEFTLKQYTDLQFDLLKSQLGQRAKNHR